MHNTNEMTVEFQSIPQNESFARMVVAAFITGTNPTLEEVSAIITAVTEAVRNAMIHGYEHKEGIVKIRARVDGRTVYLEISDKGCGIQNISQAMEPLYTSKPEEERSGMGFSFMEAFMDRLEVESTYGVGTIVKMWKEIGVTGHPYE